MGELYGTGGFVLGLPGCNWVTNKNWERGTVCRLSSCVFVGVVFLLAEMITFLYCALYLFFFALLLVYLIRESTHYRKQSKHKQII